MITPTRTVCYAIPEEDAEQELKVTHASSFGLEVEYSKGLYGLLNYSEVRRIIVREEPIEQYYPGMVHAGDFSGLEIEPGKIVRYPMCNKSLHPLNPCDCGNCTEVLKSYPRLRGEIA
tara:strand:- start:377 stop:730 length:354 start_codon:yes stop_codon:yes gene_type:complete